MSESSLDKIISLCKRRGFIFQSSEIYGGFGAVYDYGPLGVELKNNISHSWWKFMTHNHENIVGLDSGIFMHPKIWEASGHVDAFNDPLVDCKQCKARYRADELIKEDFMNANWAEIQCPKCGTTGNLTNPRQFNLMFKTNIGPIESESETAYLRPETAQGIYVNFTNVQNTTRMKIPFGIAQIGKAFRNEITTGNFIFRCREFEQMELEFFTEPDSAEKWFDYWIQERFNWYLTLGINKSDLRIRPHENTELAHYSKGCSDIEYNFPWGWGELETINNESVQAQKALMDKAKAEEMGREDIHEALKQLIIDRNSKIEALFDDKQLEIIKIYTALGMQYSKHCGKDRDGKDDGGRKG